MGYLSLQLLLLIFAFMSINISPACRYHSVLLIPHTLFVGELGVCTAWWVHTAVPCCTHWVKFHVESPHVHMPWHPPVPAGSTIVPGGVARDMLQGPRMLAREPGENSVHYSGRGNVNSDVHCFLSFWIGPSAAGSLSDFLCHFSSLGYLPPEKRRRGALALNWFYLRMGSIVINIWCYLNASRDFEGLGNLFPHILPKLIIWNKFLWCSNGRFYRSYQTEGYKMQFSFS